MTRRARSEPTGVADPRLFDREFEVVRTEAGTELRVRPTAELAFGEHRVRQISLLGGVVLVIAGLVGALFFGANERSSWAWWFPLVVFGGLGQLCLLVAWVGGPRRDYLLTVSSAGEVRHRGRVVGPGEAVAVWVHCTTDIDSEDGTESHCAYLYIERHGGQFVEIPGPRFSRVGNFGLGRALAGKLADVLKVPLRDGEPPEKWSAPRRADVSNRRWGTAGMLLIGVPHFLGGVSILLALRQVWWVGLIFTCSGAGLIAGACWTAGWGRRGFGLIIGGLLLAVLLVWRMTRGGW